ncbi:MAG TPA: cytochrome C oxidase subunit IV family protein [Marinobacter sp.]|nr:cytochrome C oxidase subunit IV family protein [Marinobacter sp.]
MMTVFLALLACTVTPVLIMHTTGSTTVLLWVVFSLVLIKAVLLVDHFMEMKSAPQIWRLAAQSWAVVVVAALAALHVLS